MYLKQFRKYRMSNNEIKSKALLLLMPLIKCDRSILALLHILAMNIQTFIIMLPCLWTLNRYVIRDSGCSLSELTLLPNLKWTHHILYSKSYEQRCQPSRVFLQKWVDPNETFVQEGLWLVTGYLIGSIFIFLNYAIAKAAITAQWTFAVCRQENILKQYVHCEQLFVKQFWNVEELLLKLCIASLQSLNFLRLLLLHGSHCTHKPVSELQRGPL